MKIELLKGWNGHAPGEILEPYLDGVALALMERGLAKSVDEQPKPKRQIKLQEWVKKST